VVSLFRSVGLAVTIKEDLEDLVNEFVSRTSDVEEFPVVEVLKTKILFDTGIRSSPSFLSHVLRMSLTLGPS